MSKSAKDPAGSSRAGPEFIIPRGAEVSKFLPTSSVILITRIEYPITAKVDKPPNLRAARCIASGIVKYNGTERERRQ